MFSKEAHVGVFHTPLANKHWYQPSLDRASEWNGSFKDTISPITGKDYEILNVEKLKKAVSPRTGIDGLKSPSSHSTAVSTMVGTSSALTEQTGNLLQPWFCIAPQDSSKIADHPARIARFMRCSVDAKAKGVRLYNGYSLWLWHTGQEFSYADDSAYNRAFRAFSYIEKTAQTIKLALTTEQTLSSRESLRLDTPSTVAEQIKARLELDHPTEDIRVDASSTFLPDMIILDLEHHFLGTRGDPKSVEFLNEFVKLVRDRYPSTQIAVTTYGDAIKYVNAGRGSELTFDIDVIIPQAYHGGYFSRAKDLFIDRQTSVTAMALKSWLLSAHQAFPTYVGNDETSILPAGMPIIRKGKLDGINPSPGDDDYSFTTSWPLYLTKGPAARCWWSDTILTRHVTNDHSSVAVTERNVNYDMLVYYYVRMLKLGFGPNMPVFSRDSMHSTIDVNKHGALVIRDIGDYDIMTSSYMVRRPDDMSDLTFNILCALDLARSFKQSTDDSTSVQVVASNCVHFDTANFLAAMSMVSREALSDVIQEQGSKEDTKITSSLPSPVELDELPKYEFISVKSSALLKGSRYDGMDAPNQNVGYDILIRPSIAVASLIEQAKAHDSSLSGSSLDFNFIGKVSLSIVHDTAFGSHDYKRVPLINHPTVILDVDQIEFAPHEDEEYDDDTTIPAS